MFYFFFHISLCQILYIMKYLLFSVVVMNSSIFFDTMPCSALLFDGLSNVTFHKKEPIQQYIFNIL
jgi:hypothetical protein